MRKIYFCHDRVKSSADPHPAKPEKVFGKTFKTSGNGSKRKQQMKKPLVEKICENLVGKARACDHSSFHPLAWRGDSPLEGYSQRHRNAEWNGSPASRQRAFLLEEQDSNLSHPASAVYC